MAPGVMFGGVPLSTLWAASDSVCTFHRLSTLVNGGGVADVVVVDRWGKFGDD